MLSNCTSHETEKPLDLPADLFREGDTVFRKGTGLTCQSVLPADKEGAYSHTGILKQLALDSPAVISCPTTLASTKNYT